MEIANSSVNSIPRSTNKTHKTAAFLMKRMGNTKIPTCIGAYVAPL